MKKRLVILILGIVGIVLSFICASPIINFTNPTPENNDIRGNNWMYINTTITGGNTSFIDFNNSVVGWWRMNNESGENSTFVKDWSAWGNNGTITGANYTISGQFAGAFEFDGNDDYVLVANDDSLNITNEITMSAWVKLPDVTDYSMILVKLDSDETVSDSPYMLGFYQSKVYGWLENSTGRITFGGGSKTLTNNEWHHLLITWNGTHAIKYLDGQSDGAYSVTGNLLKGSGKLKIARAADDPFNGSIDEILLFDRTLSSEEVGALYNSTSNLYHNFTNLDDGNYSIKAHSQNSTGYVNSTEVRYVTVYTKIGVSLNSPSNNAVTSNTSINFNCSASINNNLYKLSNVTLYTNYFGNFISNGTNSFSGTSNNTNFTRSFSMTDKSFVWNCYACDNESRCSFASANRTLILDYTAPNINFTDDTSANNSVLNYDWIFINSSINDTSRTSSFIDFNRSLKLWLRFNNESGENSTFVKDWSDWGNNGTITGANYTISGQFAGAFEFDGNDDYIDVGSRAFNQGDYTFVAWVKNMPTGDTQNIIAGGTDGQYIRILTNGLISSYVRDTDSNLRSISSTTNVSDGDWHFVALTINYSGFSNIYVDDGVSEGSSNVAFTGDLDSGNLFIGKYSLGRFFNGSIDEILLFDRTLSSEEVGALYNSTAYTLYHNFTNLGDGDYTFKLYAQDVLGHISSEYREVEVWDDPRIIVNYPDSNDTNVRTFAELNVTVSNYEGNSMDISFYNGSSEEVICQNNSVANGTTLICNWTGLAELTWNNWSVNATDGITTTLYNDRFYIGPFITIKEYYDDRQMGVIFTGDDWDGSTRHTSFMEACDASQATGVVFSLGLIPEGILSSGNISLNSSQWRDIQEQIDEGWVSPTSHSTHHRHENNITLEDAEDEIQGSWDAIVGNLTLPSTLTFNGTEYLLGFITPYYIWNDNVTYWFNQTGFLVSRGNNGVDPSPQGWGIWNDTWNFYGVRRTLDIGDGGSLEFRKNSFDTSYVNRVVWHLMTHPLGLNWSEDSENWQLLEYIGNRTDVWYAGLGEMFAYHYVQNMSLTNISILSSANNLSDIEVKINISSQERNKYGLSYPMTYEVSIPNEWDNVIVYYKNTSDGIYTRMTEKDRTTVWNGIDAYRKNMSEDRVYVSKAFSQTSNDLYLLLRPTAILSTEAQSAENSDVSLGGSLTGTYKPSESSLEKGFSVNIVSEQKVQITYSNGKTKDVKVESVSEEKVVVSVDGVNYEVSSGSSVKIDLDGDGFYDVEISNKKVYSNGVANLEFKLIHEEVASGGQEEQKSNVGEVIEDIDWYVYVIIGVVIILIVVGIVLKKRR